MSTDARGPTALETLSEIASTINSLEDPERLLETILESAMEAVGAERGFVIMVGAAGLPDLQVKSHRNFKEDELGELERISRSAVTEVIKTGEPLLLYEAQKDDRFGTSESVVVEQIQSIACVPLTMKSRRIGAIYLDSISHRGNFTRESLPLLTAIANQSAIAIDNARLYQSIREENRQLREEIQRLHGFEEIIGRSRPMRDVFDTMSRVIDSDASVLIEGESGTGKELVARAIHYNGARKAGPFVAVFCGSLPDELLESELFGHKKGSFTGAVSDKKGLFEVANHGTVFLDEVGDLSPRMQTSLLRVLQEGEIRRVGDTDMRRVDVRIISATNKSLEDLTRSGDFREDLFYRLNTIDITIPPLRRRGSDVELLANHFLDTLAVKSRAHIRGFDDSAVQAMRAYSWPGNVRELENIIERAVVLCRGDVITAEDLRLRPVEERDPFEAGNTLRDVERIVTLRTLEELDGNISETARTLGVSRRWLHYKLKEWGSENP